MGRGRTKVDVGGSLYSVTLKMLQVSAVDVAGCCPC